MLDSVIFYCARGTDITFVAILTLFSIASVTWPMLAFWSSVKSSGLFTVSTLANTCVGLGTGYCMRRWLLPLLQWGHWHVLSLFEGSYYNPRIKQQPDQLDPLLRKLFDMAALMCLGTQLLLSLGYV